MTPAEFARVFDWYIADLPQNSTFQQEIHRWSTFCQDLKDKPSSLFDVLILADPDYYLNIREMFHILLTMPIDILRCRLFPLYFFLFLTEARLPQWMLRLWSKTCAINLHLCCIMVSLDFIASALQWNSSFDHANRIRSMWTIFFWRVVSKATEQNNNGRGQIKWTSIIACSKSRKCWQGQNTRQIRYGQ
jgi:hypothetical protein